jgi:hypothetical protein
MWCKVRVNVILLHVDTQFPQHHLLKELSFPHWMVLAHMLHCLAIYARVCVWAIIFHLSS